MVDFVKLGGSSSRSVGSCLHLHQPGRLGLLDQESSSCCYCPTTYQVWLQASKPADYFFWHLLSFLATFVDCQFTQQTTASHSPMHTYQAELKTSKLYRKSWVSFGIYFLSTFVICQQPAPTASLPFRNISAVGLCTLCFESSIGGIFLSANVNKSGRRMSICD